MDEMYRARLASTPHPPGHIHSSTGQNDNMALPTSGAAHVEEIHIHPPAAGTAQPIPIQLPNIYVNAIPPAVETRHQGTDHRDTPSTSNSPNAPTGQHKKSHNHIKIGPWKVARPHPLLWVCLAISIVALVLGVPKGSLPTLTGRHKALRAQEKLLTQKAELITHLSQFLPPPLSTLVAPALPTDPTTSLLASNDRQQIEYLYNGGLRFWNNLPTTVVGGGNDERWWAVEELGEGASLVRSKMDGKEREVWVLRMGDDRDGHKALQNALTHSLLLRDRLQSDLEKERSRGHAKIDTIAPAASASAGNPAQTRASQDETTERDAALDRQRDALLKEERQRLEDYKRREREREREVEEREVEVARREKWVVAEMRKLSDRVHAQATELTLEDRITERVKTYQRQLAQIKADDQELAQGPGSRSSAARSEL